MIIDNWETLDTANQIIKDMQEVLDSNLNNGIKISRILILISGNDNVKHDRMVQTIGTMGYSKIDLEGLKAIFSGGASPYEKVASFFHLVTQGNAEKYDKISDILAS